MHAHKCERGVAPVGATPLSSVLRYDDDITVEIVDDGVGGTASVGNGITGMRERVAALGGHLETGPEDARRVPGRRPATSRRMDRLVITVLLANDQALVRAGFRALLDAQPDIEVVAEATNGDEAVHHANQIRPTSY